MYGSTCLDTASGQCYYLKHYYNRFQLQLQRHAKGMLKIMDTIKVVNYNHKVLYISQLTIIILCNALIFVPILGHIDGVSKNCNFFCKNVFLIELECINLISRCLFYQLNEVISLLSKSPDFCNFSELYHLKKCLRLILALLVAYLVVTVKHAWPFNWKMGSQKCLLNTRFNVIEKSKN